MLTGLYAYAAVAVAAAALGGSAAWRTQEWRHGAIEAKRLQDERMATEARETDARQQRAFNDRAAGTHAAELAGLNTQLGKARAQIALLSSDRQCLDGDTVRVLNNIGKPAGGLGLRAATGQPAGAASAAAGSGADATGYASERSTADQIATCRAQHAELASQVNQILDIEDRRDARRAN
ncbi:hypothetical protein [Acidovorax sp. NCPPB 4044]|uniref:hypothetical protein n=1 Tax=Acidovorax sp. NCPPB 4044 TaxID=2940490 RepID=UPI002303819B|nr:hypothetical protein [Acidovorax sp. NCPPB 4044]MDA8522296.1 hypothetical protein [Acidovorax sp. NCPPB 4044]